MNPQEGLYFESKYCSKPACGSPMIPYHHLGRSKMRCSKKKCQHISAKHVSVYFHQSGATHIAIRCLCDAPCNRHPVAHPHAHVYAVVSMMHVTRRPIGGSSRKAAEQFALSIRTQTEIAMCFAWGTAMHPHTSSTRRPLCCVYTMTDCRPYVCIDHYTLAYDVLHISHDQDWDAARAHAGAVIGQPPNPPRDC